MKVVSFTRALGVNLEEIVRNLQDTLERVLLPLTKQDEVTAPTLQNGWANYGSGYSEAGYWKDSHGVVHLRGKVSGGSGDTVIFTLPSGYRPASTLAFCSTSATSGGAREVDINNSGEISIPYTGAASPFILLDGITFRAEK